MLGSDGSGQTSKAGREGGRGRSLPIKKLGGKLESHVTTFIIVGPRWRITVADTSKLSLIWRWYIEPTVISCSLVYFL